MLQRPNEKEVSHEKDIYNYRNQIGRRFSDIFDILLDPGYYEGTPYGANFTKTNEDGTSTIYVKDVQENELDSFCKKKGHLIKYLVGFTGMGKTTLLRNYFRVLDRDVHINNGNLIIYISFYYSKLNSDHPQESVESEVISYIREAIKIILTRYPELHSDSDKFWSDLFSYIDKNKPTILQSEEITPELELDDFFVPSSEKTLEQKKKILSKTCARSSLEYYSSFLKFLVSQCNAINQSNIIKNIYCIFDDIESKEAIFHRPVVEVARHLQSCFSCIVSDNVWVKTLVSLRAYTFRSNVDRQLEARREQIQKNTIFKIGSVGLRDIFRTRFKALEKAVATNEKIKSKSSYDDAVAQMNALVQQMDGSFSHIITRLANCNLCNAMMMFNSVLVNVQWVAVNETEVNGSFKVSAENYKLTSKTVFQSIACGNELAYNDRHNNFFPNFLHNGKDEGAELINLLLYRYVVGKGATDLYGEQYVQRNDIIHDVSSVFTKMSDSISKVERWKERVVSSLDYLYGCGIFLKSIYDIDNLNSGNIERNSEQAVKLYVSPRGQFLYSLFSMNCLLLELYRDAIYVDIPNNDKLTAELDACEMFEYLINYIARLFTYEKKNIGDAIQNLEKYQEIFGAEFLISPLLEGVVKNLNSYKIGSKQMDLRKKATQLLHEVRQYMDEIRQSYGIVFGYNPAIDRELGLPW